VEDSSLGHAMSDSSYEILCSSCRTAIPSSATVCPACGLELGRRAAPPFAAQTVAAPAGPAPAAQAWASSAPAPVYTPALRADGSRAYAGFWIRVAAVIVDEIVLGVPYYLLLQTFGNPALLALIPMALYYPLMESSGAQGTLGKLTFGLKVTDTSHRRISFGRALGRYLAKIPSGLLLCLGYVMVAFTPQKRGLHDYIAGTVVLRA
jgi:uncharacterized RDD family membrane protein YckC